MINIRVLVISIVYWLNRILNYYGFSDVIIPDGIIEGRSVTDYNRKRISFGTCAMGYARTNNDIDSRCTPVGVLKDAKEYGGFKCLSLVTGNLFSLWM